LRPSIRARVSALVAMTWSRSWVVKTTTPFVVAEGTFSKQAIWLGVVKDVHLVLRHVAVDVHPAAARAREHQPVMVP
jgi:hypothetical protein